MQTVCPNCLHAITIEGLGRKRLDTPVKNVLEALKRHKSTILAAQELNCSPAHIYNLIGKDKIKELITK